MNDLELEQKMIDEFGITQDIGSAGFIDTRGNLIDLSEGGGMGRTADHRAAIYLMDDYDKYENRSDALDEFLRRTGAIRISAYGDHILLDAEQDPTHEQYKTIRYILSYGIFNNVSVSPPGSSNTHELFNPSIGRVKGAMNKPLDFSEDAINEMNSEEGYAKDMVNDFNRRAKFLNRLTKLAEIQEFLDDEELSEVTNEVLDNLASDFTPTDKKKWSAAKAKAKRKFDVYPSAYANAWASKEYKRMGGGWRKKKKKKKNNAVDSESIEKGANLRRWLKEDWVDISKKDKSGKHPPCGRKDADKGKYPKCRPSKKVNNKTPKTSGEMSKSEKTKATNKKRKVEKNKPSSSAGGGARKPKRAPKISSNYSMLKKIFGEKRMYLGQLKNIIEYANKVHEMLESSGEASVPEWVESHVATISDDISEVYHYLEDHHTSESPYDKEPNETVEQEVSKKIPADRVYMDPELAEILENAEEVGFAGNKEPRRQRALRRRSIMDILDGLDED